MTSRNTDLFQRVVDAPMFWFPCVSKIVKVSGRTADIEPQVTLGGKPVGVIYDAPMLLPTFGNWALKFTPKPGDEVATLFCCHSTTLWPKGSGKEHKNARFSDAMILPGLLRVDDTVSENEFEITNSAGTLSLKFNQLPITAIPEIIVTGPLTGGVPGSFNLLTHTHSSPAGGATGGPIAGT